MKESYLAVEFKRTVHQFPAQERALNAAGQAVWDSDVTASSDDGVYDSTYEPTDTNGDK